LENNQKYGMTPNILQQRLYSTLNKEYCKRLLIRYFVSKGFQESFDKKIYPPKIQDLTSAIPQLAGKIEIEPYVEDIDPNNGIYHLGWNLFVLGTKRLFLGYSTHTNLSEVKSPIAGPTEGGEKILNATPRRVINFVTALLANSKNGDITRGAFGRKSMLFVTGDQSGYFKRRPVF
jgi:hypothetical protein